MPSLLTVSVILCNVFLDGKNDPLLLTSAPMELSQHSQNFSLHGPVPLSHFILRQLVRPGDQAIDATCGNGNDTLLLAWLVGTAGQVFSFDIQPDAISKTTSKLDCAGLGDRVRTIQTGHETISQYVEGTVKAVVFNLGYLPGGDKNLITKPDTTLAALESSADLLAIGGMILITIYPGHSGGDDERDAVESWAGGLPAKQFHVWRMGQINVSNSAPYLLLIQKAAR
jgi:SAM-dependent methyltransferase